MERQGQIINFQAPAEISSQPPKPAQLISVEGTKITTKPYNLDQWVRFDRARRIARLPRNLLVNTGEEMGDSVEEAVITLSVDESLLKNQVGEPIRGENFYIFLEETGNVLITSQIPNPQSEQNIIPTNQVTGVGPQNPQEVTVLEGVGIFADQTNNLFLSAPAKLKKAA